MTFTSSLYRFGDYYCAVAQMAYGQLISCIQIQPGSDLQREKNPAVGIHFSDSHAISFSTLKFPTHAVQMVGPWLLWINSNFIPSFLSLDEGPDHGLELLVYFSAIKDRIPLAQLML
jgi:hypothetical protein